MLEYPVLETKELSLFYRKEQALNKINLHFQRKTVTALIGPSGCGKSSLLRCLNRMNDLIPEAHIYGQILFKGEDILHNEINPIEIRYRIGMVFQKPNPFPKSIFENVAFGLRINGLTDNLEIQVERALQKAGIWDEVKDRLHRSALELSGGQQQRLCIARAIILEPEVLLLDEPCSALDPIATEKIEHLINQLRHDHTVVIVTHNMQQAKRISEFTGFMLNGQLIEYGKTKQIFEKPTIKETVDYVAGRFG
mgnify:CR=1 FL=1